MKERQRYYEELVEYIVEKYYATKLDRTQDTESPLPKVRIDMLFEIPGEVVSQVKESPLPFLSEINIVHIKAYGDTLSRQNLVQYLGELYVMATSDRAKGKSTVLIILSASPPSKNLRESFQFAETKWEGMYRIEAEEPAYLVVIDEVARGEGMYRCFLPFGSPSRIRKRKGEFVRIVQVKPPTMEEALILMWLRKLNPEFYKQEVEKMGISKEEIASTLFPDMLEEIEAKGREKGREEGREEGLQKAILRFLKARFGAVPEELTAKVEAITSIEQLDSLIEKAATCARLEEFEKGMETA